MINSTVDNGIRMMGESKKRDDNLTAQSVVFEKISNLLWNLGIDAQINYDDGFSADLFVELSPAGVARACQIYEEEGCDE